VNSSLNPIRFIDPDGMAVTGSDHVEQTDEENERDKQKIDKGKEYRENFEFQLKCSMIMETAANRKIGSDDDNNSKGDVTGNTRDRRTNDDNKKQMTGGKAL
jgi:hypothetical protein